MQGDSESRLPEREGPDIWRLPPLVLVEMVRVRYAAPRRHVVKGKLVSHREGVEILVRTEEPIPIRALSPALFIGDEQVVENEAMGPSDYRFFVPDEKRLKAGAPIRLGWVDTPPAAAKKGREKGFRYKPPTREVTELSLRLRREN
jgi:hypothetical protein